MEHATDAQRAWTRRSVIQVAAATVAGAILSACGGSSSTAPTTTAASTQPVTSTQASSAATQPSGSARAGTTPAAQGPLEKELVIVDTGGSFGAGLRKHFYDPFEKATGVKITAVAASSDESFTKLKAGAQAGKVEYDILSTSPATSFQYRDYLVNLDCAQLTNLSQTLTGSCAGNGVLRTFGGNVIAYNAQKFPNGGPQSYADFWDTKKFPGPRAVINLGVAQWVLAIALLADGVTTDKLIPMDLDRAFKKLDQIKPDVKVWWKTGDQSQQILRDGEVVMSFMASGRAITLKKEGLPIEVQWNQAVKDYATWGVAKNAPHPKAAFAFLDFFLGNPQEHAAFSLEVNNSTSNRPAADLLPAAEKPNFAATYWDKMIDIDGSQWVQENRGKINEQFQAWLSK